VDANVEYSGVVKSFDRIPHRSFIVTSRFLLAASLKNLAAKCVELLTPPMSHLTGKCMRVFALVTPDSTTIYALPTI
jgi:hypothetical protein